MASYRYGGAWVTVSVDTATPKPLFGSSTVPANSKGRVGWRAKTHGGSGFHVLILKSGSAAPVATDFTTGVADYTANAEDLVDDGATDGSDIWILSRAGTISVLGRELF